MMTYEARIAMSGELETYRFKTDGNPVEFLWERFGMSSYIESLKEIKDEQKGD